jgi:hypothetical protein
MPATLQLPGHLCGLAHSCVQAVRKLLKVTLLAPSRQPAHQLWPTQPLLQRPLVHGQQTELSSNASSVEQVRPAAQGP